jgi:hypothetical protein
MSDRPNPPQAARSADDRRADHEAIERLAAEVLPALVARLASSSLGEVEVREDAWRVRIRRPAGERRGSGRGSSGRGRDEGRHGDGGRSTEHRSVGQGLSAGVTPSGQAPPDSGASGPADGGTLPPLTSVSIEPGPTRDQGPLVAPAPAVGIFRLRSAPATDSPAWTCWACRRR